MWSHKNGQYQKFGDTEKSGLFFTLPPNNIYGEVENIFLFSDDSLAVHSQKSRSEGLQEPRRTVQKARLLCLYYLLSDFSYTGEATVLDRTIHHSAWVLCGSLSALVMVSQRRAEAACTLPGRRCNRGR